MINALKAASPLACLYYHEQQRADTRWMTQPSGNGQVSTLTWGQAADQIRRMAAHLSALNLPEKSQIALVGKNSAHWVLADLAIWMAGHVTVPLYPTLAPETVRYILEHSESKLLIIGKLDDWPVMQPGVTDNLPCITLPLSPDIDHAESWDSIMANNAPLSGHPDRQMDELATIVYTSGSTGQPKGVMASFGALSAMARNEDAVLSYGSDDRMLSYLPLAHMMERTVVEMPSLYAGFELYFAEELDTFLQDLQRARPTIFLSVPRLWSKFMSAVCDKLPRKKQDVLFRIPILGSRVKHKILTQLGLESVRYAGTGSAPLSADIVSWYRSLGLELLEGYGMSENCAYSHGSRAGETRVGYVGHANPGVECLIADNGEILVRSPANMMGYFRDPERTAETLDAQGYIHTGDMGEIDAQGRLKITGRLKDLFKLSKGKYIAPVPIENRLTASDNVEVCCVLGANRGAACAMIVLAENLRAQLAQGRVEAAAVSDELEQLRTQVNLKLDPHEQLAFLVVVSDVWSIEDGFLTPTMKIKRNVIESHYEAKLDQWYSTKESVIWQQHPTSA